MNIFQTTTKKSVKFKKNRHKTVDVAQTKKKKNKI